ncbi:MAG: flagellar basal-body rod protein FlgG [Pseudomonadota bacterium]
MTVGLWAAKTGLDAQQTRMAVVSNNLANASTTAFKRGRPIFEDLLYQNLAQAGSQTSQDTQSPSGLHLGTGVRVVATERTFTQGSLNSTANALDMAIEGRGFFEILLPDGTSAYTRDGSFQVDRDGQLVTSSGYIVQPGINLPPGVLNFSVGADGTISVQLSGQTAPTQVGTMQLVDFVNPGGLQPRGKNLYLETGASGPPSPGIPGLDGLGTIQQGYLEASNVNVVEELVTMIETQRAYEMSSKAIATSDQMLQYVNNNL